MYLISYGRAREIRHLPTLNPQSSNLHTMKTFVVTSSNMLGVFSERRFHIASMARRCMTFLAYRMTREGYVVLETSYLGDYLSSIVLRKGLELVRISFSREA